MAAAASQVAHDLSRFDNRTRVRRAMALEERERQPALKAREGARAKEKTHLSAWVVLGFALATALMLLVVYSHVQITELTNQANGVKKQITQLQKESNELRVLKNNMIDLKEIARIATEDLGMVKPTRDQVIYIDLSEGDSATVLKNDGGGLFK